MYANGTLFNSLFMPPVVRMRASQADGRQFDALLGRSIYDMSKDSPLVFFRQRLFFKVGHPSGFHVMKKHLSSLNVPI